MDGEIIDAREEGWIWPVAMDLGAMYTVEFDPNSTTTETAVGLIFYTVSAGQEPPDNHEAVADLPKTKIMLYPSQVVDLVAMLTQQTMEIVDDAESAGLNVL